MYNSHVILKRISSNFPQVITSFIKIYTLIIIIVISWFSMKAIRFPYGLDYGEAPLMDQATRIQHHDVLYKNDINSPPYIIANYPPLYPVVVAGINTIFNIPLFQTGRILSLFFSVISAIIIGLFSYKLTENKVIGATAAAIFMGNPYVAVWSSIARVDMMALAFSLLGLYILYRKRDSKVWIIITCLCFLVSAFTRQTYLLAGPLAGLVWLYHLNPRRALLFLITFAASTLLIFGTINAMTNGGFYFNIVIANINQYELSRTIILFERLFILWPVLIIASVIMLTMSVIDWRKTKRTPVTENVADFPVYGLIPFTMAAFAVGLTVGKVGSDINYFLELMAVCALWMAMVLSWLLKQENLKRWLFFGLIFTQLIWVLVATIYLDGRFIDSRWNQLHFYDSLYQRIDQSAQEGIVLSDDYLDMVVKSGQPIYYQPFEYGALYQAGLWDAKILSNEITQQKFPLIIIGGDTVEKSCCWPSPMVDALRANYKAEAESNLILLTPKR